MRNVTKVPLVAFFATLLVLTSAHGWAINQPTPPSNELILARGSTTRFCESVQNMVGDGEDITVKLEILRGCDTAQFVKVNDDDTPEGNCGMLMSVPFGEIKKPWCLDITIPENYSAGSEFDITVKASKQETSGGGQVRFSTGQLAKVFVEVKEGGEPEQYEPPDEKGVVSNKTQGIVADLEHQFAAGSGPVTDSGDSSVLYTVIAFACLIGVASMLFALRQMEVI